MENKENLYWNEIYGKITENEISCEDGNKYGLYDMEKFLYSEKIYKKLIGDPNGKRILSIGSGIDFLAIDLAKRGGILTCIDESEEAARKTLYLSHKLNLGSRLKYFLKSGEDLDFCDQYDLVLSHKALHHMDFFKTLPKIYDSLKKGGIFIAEEPVCLLPLLRIIHRKIPFHPDYPFFDSEIELSIRELNFVKQKFSKTGFYFLNTFTRPSISFFFKVIGAGYLVKPLSIADYYLIKLSYFFKFLSSHVVIRAVK